MGLFSQNFGTSVKKAIKEIEQEQIETSEKSPSKTDKTFQIFVRWQGKTITVDVSDNMKLEDAFKQISKKTGVPVKSIMEDLYFVYGGKKVDVTKPISYLKITKEATLEMIGRLLGGEFKEGIEPLDLTSSGKGKWKIIHESSSNLFRAGSIKFDLQKDGKSETKAFINFKHFRDSFISDSSEDLERNLGIAKKSSIEKNSVILKSDKEIVKDLEDALKEFIEKEDAPSFTGKIPYKGIRFERASTDKEIHMVPENISDLITVENYKTEDTFSEKTTAYDLDSETKRKAQIRNKEINIFDFKEVDSSLGDLKKVYDSAYKDELVKKKAEYTKKINDLKDSVLKDSALNSKFDIMAIQISSIDKLSNANLSEMKTISLKLDEYQKHLKEYEEIIEDWFLKSSEIDDDDFEYFKGKINEKVKNIEDLLKLDNTNDEDFFKNLNKNYKEKLKDLELYVKENFFFIEKKEEIVDRIEKLMKKFKSFYEDSEVEDLKMILDNKTDDLVKEFEENWSGKKSNVTLIDDIIDSLEDKIDDYEFKTKKDDFDSDIKKLNARIEKINQRYEFTSEEIIMPDNLPTKYIALVMDYLDSIELYIENIETLNAANILRPKLESKLAELEISLDNKREEKRREEDKQKKGYSKSTLNNIEKELEELEELEDELKEELKKLEDEQGELNNNEEIEIEEEIEKLKDKLENVEMMFK